MLGGITGESLGKHSNTENNPQVAKLSAKALEMIHGCGPIQSCSSSVPPASVREHADAAFQVVYHSFGQQKQPA